MEKTEWVDASPRRWNWYKVGAIACGAVIVAILAAILVVVATDNDWFTNKESKVESLCTDEIKSQLRDPDSAEFYELNDVTFLEGDTADMYGLEGKVRARNGFGGMVNNQFSCGVIWGDGDPEVHAWTY